MQIILFRIIKFYVCQKLDPHSFTLSDPDFQYGNDSLEKAGQGDMSIRNPGTDGRGYKMQSLLV